MIRFGIVCILLATVLTACGASAPLPKDAGDATIALDANIDIPFTKFVLDNGLTLIVHEDPKAPIVAVNIWYHVGSKNEKPGRTGFAHLFEHLMFNGSENYNDDYFQPLERVGATDLNGTTNEDRTNYFQNVPTTALDTVLFLESDRMGHLKGAVDQARLDEQRGVVQNEKRQRENQPYGMAWELMIPATYPAGHPYSWSVIGSMDDLNAASVEDVHEWFDAYYGAANAVVVVAGDITPEVAYAKVEQYFGDIPAGPPIPAFDSWVAKREDSRRQIYHDRVPQSRVYKQWNVAEWGSEDAAYIDLLTAVLSEGKSSRFYKRLVYDEQLATSVQVYYDEREISGQLFVIATAKPGVELADVEKALDEELQRLIEEGCTARELKRAKTERLAAFIRGIERIGGFRGKSDILAKSEVLGGDPAMYKVKLERIKNATPDQLQQVAARWFSSGEYVLEIHPYPEFGVGKSSVDRSRLPEMTGAPEAKFPKIKRAKLDNGMGLVVAERHSVPVVLFEMVFDAGFASDKFTAPGTAKLAMAMLDEGTETRSSIEISDEQSMLGARLSSGSNLDQSFVYLSALKDNLEPSLNLFADVVLNPSFPEADFERLRKTQLARIEQEMAQPFSMALRLFPELLFGKDHAYGIPFTGSGYAQTVSAITREDLKKFKDQWLGPNNATLLVVGDTTLEEIKPKIEALFANWSPVELAEKNIGPAPAIEKSKLYLIDRPGAIQSLILAGHGAPPKSDAQDIALEMTNQVLGGTFTSRINMNLREDKHWTYGSRSLIYDTQGERPFLVYAPVQADKTRESLQEILGEITGILAGKPVTEDELAKVRKNKVLKLPGRWETMSNVEDSILEIVRFGLADDYFDTYAQKIKAQSLADLQGAAKYLLKPEKMIWVVVGDLKTIEPGLRELGFGEVEVVTLK